MNRSATEAWLADIQRRFGELVRTPLDATSGTLRAQPKRYDETLVAAVQGAARARLAVYNRQYWFRLLTVMQHSWQLTARLLGLFHFNLHAQAFLLEHPPCEYDLRSATLGFDHYLAARRTEPLVLEAAALDATFARVFHAPAEPRFDPKKHSRRALLQRKLIRSSAYARFEEHWPLVELRSQLQDDSSESAEPAPPPLRAAQTWAIYRNPQGIAQLHLTPWQARLMTLLEHHPLGEALALLEAEAPAETRSSLPDQTQTWIAQAIHHGFWTALADDATS